MEKDFSTRYGIHISQEQFHALFEQGKSVLLNGNEIDTRQLAASLSHQHYSLAFLYLEVIIPVLDAITDEWVNGPRAFAEVHTAWEQAEVLVPILAHNRLEEVTFTKPALLVSCVEGNEHPFGTRMLADLLTEAHYPVTYLTAPTHRSTILEACRIDHPACAVLSVSMPSQFDELLATADALHRQGCTGKIAAGGHAITPQEPPRWKNHGIDWVGSDPVVFIHWLDQHVAATGKEERAA